MSSPVLQCADTIELLNFNFIAYQCEIWLTWLSTSYRLLRPSRGFLEFWLLTYLHWTKPSINASHGSLLVNNQFLILKPIKLVPPCLSLNPLLFLTEGFKMLTTNYDCNHTTSSIPALKENIPCQRLKILTLATVPNLATLLTSETICALLLLSEPAV